MERLFNNKHCFICNKDFIVPEPGAWVYRIGRPGGHYYFCSWSCMQKFRERRKK